MSALAGALERRFRTMGTDAILIAPSGSGDALDAARAVLDSWDRRFSRFDPNSELSRINANAGAPIPTAISAEAVAAISTAILAARATDGLFDPLLGARMVELGYDRTFDELRDDGPVSLSAWTPRRWREIDLDISARTIRLPPRTALDLGGLAKGMAVDAALAMMIAAGTAFAAVSAGGDLAVHGTPPEGESWVVALDDSSDRTVGLSDGAIATSSVAHRRWTRGGQSHHHLIDPRTGRSARSGLVQASAAARTCAQAEVAAKTALLLGAAAGARFLERHGMVGLLVADEADDRRVAS